MSKQRLGLGKGLGALIPELRPEVVSEESGPKSGTIEIALNKIKPNPHQPRKDFDEEKLNELAETIKLYGVLQPVIVQKTKGSYILVTGERRYRAALLAGLRTIPALIKEYDSQQSMEIALVENLQRENLNPMEEAAAYKKLLEEFNYLQEDLAQKLGRSRSAIANTIRLLSLDDEVQKYLAEGNLTAGQARPLLALSSAEEQCAFALKIIKEKLSVRQVEKLIKAHVKKGKTINKTAESSPEKKIQELFLNECAEKLRRAYGTRVIIKHGPREGKVEFSFYGEEDLERLMEILLNAGP
ncbi:MAG: ParB/RepB/Spo0J family partition protein [Dethiobacteria bacterium]|jgi:ParB family chromosome partitioning protein